MDNKQITIVAVCGMLILLTLVFACSKGCGSKSNSSYSNNNSSNTFVDFTGKSENRNGSSRYGSSGGYGSEDSDSYGSNVNSSYSGRGSGGSHSSGASNNDSSEENEPVILTKADKERLLKSYEEDEKILEKEAAKWLEERLKDADSPKAIEQYKLKANKNFVAGKEARRNKDYKQAIKYFNDVCKDPNSSPVTKYFAISNLMGVAQEMKDLELYFIAARMNAQLCSNDDLSVLGIEKNNDLLKWVNKVELSLKAKDDRSVFDECVRYKISQLQYKKLSQKEAEELVRKDIKLYSNIYKEFFE